MSKERKKIFESDTIETLEQAQMLQENCQKALERNKIACLIGLGGSAWTFLLGAFLVSVTPMSIDVYMVIGAVIGLGAVLYGGGADLMFIASVAWHLATIPLFICGFPFNLAFAFMTFAMTFGLVLVCIIAFPWAFTLIARFKRKKDLKAAEEYISYYNNNHQ